MTWQVQINKDNAVWSGVVAYAQERISDLTNMCVSPEFSEQQIRQAQAGIIEMHRLIALPQQIAAGVQIRANAGARKEY